MSAEKHRPSGCRLACSANAMSSRHRGETLPAVDQQAQAAAVRTDAAVLHPHDRTGEMHAVRTPARRDDVSPQLAALRLAPRVTPLVDRHRETQRSSEQVQQDLLAGIHTTTPLNLELSDIPLSRHAKTG